MTGARLAGLSVLAAVCATGCKPHPDAASGAPTASVVSTALTTPPPPADRLAPGELLEGPEHVFGITLPQGARIEAQFSTVAYVSGALSVHALVNYFRSRMHGGDVRDGERSATFDHVTATDRPAVPLSIHIGLQGDTARIQIRDETPPILPNLPDDASRWKHAGLTPGGRIADPTHLD